jgi:CheY-like chemotaxis protein
MQSRKDKIAPPMPLLKRKTRLLLLDDDPAMQRLISRLLERAGHRVDVVSEASQAIANIARYQYDALLLDLMTPTEGGMTVIRHLRKVQPEMLNRAVLVTASPETIVKSLAGDVSAVVRKPFEAGELVKTVERVIGK